MIPTSMDPGCNSSPEVSSNAEWSGDDDYFLHIGRTNGARIWESKKLKSGSGDVDKLPDELLMLIFGWIRSARDRCSCAAVCRRWLRIQAHMRRTDFRPGTVKSLPDDGSVNKPSSTSRFEEEDYRLERPPLWALGDLSRCLEGNRATDIMLSAAVMGTLPKRGLITVIIRGEPDKAGVTDFGLITVSLGCHFLKWLSISDCSNVGSKSLVRIAESCRYLDTLELVRCPSVTDEALEVLAKECSRLATLKIESCKGIQSKGIEAAARNGSKLVKLSLIGCDGINESVMRSLTKHCKCLTTLKLEDVGVSREGLQELASRANNLEFVVLSGLGELDDDFLLAFARACNRLYSFSLIDCPKVQGDGLSALLTYSKELLSLDIEHCPNILFKSLFMALSMGRAALKTLQIKGQLKPWPVEKPARMPCMLDSLTFNNCQGVGKRCLKLGDLRNVKRLELRGIDSLEDGALREFLEESGGTLLHLNLTDCVLLTYKAILMVGKMCPELETAVFDGCDVTDRSIGYFASRCKFLQELDVSNSSITDAGVVAVVAAVGPNLKTLSLSGCEGVSDRSLIPIRKMCDRLEVLNVKNCPVEVSGVEELQATAFGMHCKILAGEDE